jgi:hypothetical protein
MDGQIDRTSYRLERHNVAVLALEVKDFFASRIVLGLLIGVLRFRFEC